MEKKKQNNIIKTIKRDFRNKDKLSLENYLMKEKIKSKLMGEIDIEISMKKVNKN